MFISQFIQFVNMNKKNSMCNSWKKHIPKLLCYQSRCYALLLVFITIVWEYCAFPTYYTLYYFHLVGLDKKLPLKIVRQIIIFQSLIMFCSEANRGVTALVKDSKTGKPIPNADISILGIDKVMQTNEDGRFWKILLPGKYYLRVRHDNKH